MRILLTAGPTHEPIDRVRYIANRSSGRLGQALAEAALRNGDSVTVILGPVGIEIPPAARRIDVETAARMHDAVLGEFPNHDLLIMAAAVADFRPRVLHEGKIPRGGRLTLELEATEDILAAAGKIKKPNQRTVGFNLTEPKNFSESLQKLRKKNADLLVSNPLATMGDSSIEAELFWADGRREKVGWRGKGEFADILIRRAVQLFE